MGTRDQRAELDALEARMGYAFQKRTLFWQALTHTSYAHEHGASGRGGDGDYERLEFLGDAVIGLAVGERLYREAPNAPEGELTTKRAALVQEAALAAAARRIGLGPFVRLGRGEARSSGTPRDSILADVVEALIGAIYLDGGWEAAKRFALRHLVDVAGEAERLEARIPNPKGALQETTQGRGGETPEYRLVGEWGPAHARRFRAQVWVDGRMMGEGEAASKKGAEMEAARRALAAMRRKDGP